MRDKKVKYHSTHGKVPLTDELTKRIFSSFLLTLWFRSSLILLVFRRNNELKSADILEVVVELICRSLLGEVHTYLCHHIFIFKLCYFFRFDGAAEITFSVSSAMTRRVSPTWI